MLPRTRIFAAALSAALFTACAGSSNNTAAPFVPAASGNANPGTSGAAQNVAIGPQATITDVPSAAGITGTISFPAVSTPTTVAISTSTVAPAGVSLATSGRHTESDRHTESIIQLGIYEYVTMVPAKTISLAILPAFNLTFPATTAVTGKSFFYGITDPVAQPGALFGFATEGPAKITGQHVNIAAIARPITMQAGHHYTFILYATSVASGAGATVYVTSANKLETYGPDGVPRIPTITAGLSNPSIVGVDGFGTIHVLSSGASPTGQINTYLSSGVRTNPTIILPTLSDQYSSYAVSGPAVDAAGDVYVSLQTCGEYGCYDTAFVQKYDRDGKLVQTVPLPQGGGGLLAVDGTGKIYVFGYFHDRFSDYRNTLSTFSKDGKPTTPTIVDTTHSAALGLAVDTNGKIYVVRDANLTIYNADGSIATYLPLTYTPNAVAVDASGKIYIGDPADSQIFTYNADGSPSAPTITTGNSGRSLFRFSYNFTVHG